MTKPTDKKVTIVRTHPRKVPVSTKNPKGITIVDRHPRRNHGPALGVDDIRKITTSRNRKGIVYPASDDLDFQDGNNYDELIASESGFKKAPKNPKAIGITQITPTTLKALLDPEGETKDFIFKDIRKKDLKDPEIAIPMGVRWIFRKKRLAEGKLGRPPSTDEIILEYKGLLKSKSRYQKTALNDFRKYYERLKKK